MIAAPSVSRIARTSRMGAIAMGSFLSVAAVIAGLVASQLALRGNIGTVVAAAAILLPIVAWRVPQAGILLFVFAAATIEQFGSTAPGLPKIGTDRILFFTSFADEKIIPGLPINPLEITIVMLLIFWLLRSVADRTLRLPKSPVAVSMLALIVIVAFAEIHGLARGGNFQVTLRELRPWVYLASVYLLASRLLTTRSAIWALLWAFVIGDGIKGLQGIYRFAAVYHVQPRPDYILSHEDAVFFGIFVILTAALFLFGIKTRLKWVALALLPAVLFSDMANGRRVGWLILGAGLMLLCVIVFIRIPKRRPLLLGTALALAVVSLVYFPLFWNKVGTLAQPARAVRSVIAPDQRDRLSNIYRVFEDANLAVNIHRAGPLGAGFGVPIDYTAVPFEAIFALTTSQDPSLQYIPHNTILYVWLRLGIPGALAFWCVVGFGLIAACRLALAADPKMAVLGTIAACGLIAYLIMGYYDLGLSWFRVVVFIGCLLGAVEAAGHLKQSAIPSASRVELAA